MSRKEKVRALGALASTAETPGPCRILIVDDHPDTARSYSELLSAMGHQCRYTCDAREAMPLAKELNPQLALLDIGLAPDLDGHALAGLLRAQFGNAVTLVAVTAYGRDEDRRRTRKAGFDAHVTKPMDMALLESIVDTACQPD
jgi:DNA-binding response OmpR family regulator